MYNYSGPSGPTTLPIKKTEGVVLSNLTIPESGEGDKLCATCPSKSALKEPQQRTSIRLSQPERARASQIQHL